MTWLLESPWSIVLAGLAVELVLGVLLYSTGRGRWLIWMAGVTALTLTTLLVERLVVTEREQVIASLYAAAQAGEHNDLTAVLQALAPESTELRSYVRAMLGRFTIAEVHIGRNLEIRINDAADPHVATAEFVVRASGRDKQGQTPYNNYVQRVRVQLRRAPDRWLIVTANQRGLPH